MAAGAYLLDLTRLVSRLGKGAATGIDRVERAYLKQLLGQGVPVFGLLRTPAGLLLLGRDGMRMVAGWAEADPLPQAIDLIGRIARRGDPVRAAAEAALRQIALRRMPLALAGLALRRALPSGAVYLNVGHTNLSARLLRILRDGAGLRIVVMLHDTIPLDHPAFCRPDQVPGFRRRVAAISAHADLVIHTAQATRQSNERHLVRCGRVPPGVVAPLGVELAQASAARLPDLDLAAGYFVVLGTIEPRKNHALLLDVWERMAATAPFASPSAAGGEGLPRLLILGNRGWAEPRLLARLDAGVAGVSVLSGVDDAAVSWLLGHAQGLLFPSLAEGFGLPALEAVAAGTPVIASDLPVFRELLGDAATLLNPRDSVSWLETVRALATDQRGRAAPGGAPGLSTWDAHVRLVLTSI